MNRYDPEDVEALADEFLVDPGSLTDDDVYEMALAIMVTVNDEGAQVCPEIGNLN